VGWNAESTWGEARSRTISEQRQGEEQSLRAEARQQAILPEELNSQLSEVGQRTKAESGDGATNQPAKAGAWQMAELVWWD
jgi:hypothetical protein